MSDTPETDHLFDLDNMQYQRDLAMKVLKRLERERDEAREKLADALQEVDLRTLDFDRMRAERDEAREENKNLKLQLGLWEDGNLICEETLGEIRLLNEQINGAFRERDEAIELLKEVSAYSTTAAQENTEKFLRKIGKLEGAK